MDNLFIGPHISLPHDINTLDKEVRERGYTATQIFLGSPYEYSRKYVEVDKKVKDCYVFSHLPYIYNLISRKNILFHQDTEESIKNTNVLNYILKNLEYELKVVRSLNSKKKCGSVLHIASSIKDKKTALNTFIKSIDSIRFDKNSANLLLENSATSSLSSSLEDLDYIYSSVSDFVQPHLRYCFDTCHAYVSGYMNFDTNEEIDKILNPYLDKIDCIHLNDSFYGFGSRRDHHERLGYGHIWKQKKDTLFYLLEKANDKKIPIILEQDEIPAWNAYKKLKKQRE